MIIKLKTNNMKEKCNKCDERGYIKDTEYSSHSCECGWAIQEQGRMFKEKFDSIGEVFAYGIKRIKEKSK